MLSTFISSLLKIIVINKLEQHYQKNLVSLLIFFAYDNLYCLFRLFTTKDFNVSPYSQINVFVNYIFFFVNVKHSVEYA